MKLSESEEAFIAGLQDLTRKYKIAIYGCGCCSSPYLVDLKPNELTDDFRYWAYHPEDQAVLVWRAAHRPRPAPLPEVIPDTPSPITDADTVKDRAVYDAWRAKQT